MEYEKVDISEFMLDSWTTLPIDGIKFNFLLANINL